MGALEVEGRESRAKMQGLNHSPDVYAMSRIIMPGEFTHAFLYF